MLLKSFFRGLPNKLPLFANLLKNMCQPVILSWVPLLCKKGDYWGQRKSMSKIDGHVVGWSPWIHRELWKQVNLSPGDTVIDRCFLFRTELGHSLEVVFLMLTQQTLVLQRHSREPHNLKSMITACPHPSPGHHPSSPPGTPTQFFPLFPYFVLKFITW